MIAREDIIKCVISSIDQNYEENRTIEVPISRSFVEKLIETAKGNRAMTTKDLTDNQLKILRCLSDGLMRVRKQISDETGIIGKTTSNVLHRMELFDLVKRVEQNSKLVWKITDPGMKMIDEMIDRQYYERDSEIDVDVDGVAAMQEEIAETRDDHIEIVRDETPAVYFADRKLDYLPKAEIDLDEIRKRCVEFAVALRGEKGLERIDVYSRAIERLANACLLLK